MDFSVASGYVGLWKPLHHLLWIERTGIWDMLLGVFDNTHAAYGLNTLPDAKRNSSSISALLRQQFIDCIHHAAAQQSLSVDYIVPKSWRGTLPTADPGELLVSRDHPYNATPKHF